MKERIMMKNKFDIINIFLILFLLVVGFIFTYGHITSIYSDIGREFYIPWQMNEGNILYKDIFNVYFPLGYQLNAFLLKIFSNKLSVFYFAGFVVSYLSLIAIYFISKHFTNRLCSLLAVFLVIVSCVFYQSISNYIVTYSYSLLYAMCAFLWSFLMLILYLKNEKFKYFLLSCFLMGISFASKYEYCLFLFVIIFVAIYKKIEIRKCLLSVVSFLIVPLFSIFLLFIQGVSLEDIYKSAKYMIELSDSNSVKYFYSYTGFIPSVPSILRSLYCFIETLIFAGIFFVIPYSVFKYLKKFDLKIQIITILVLLFIILNVLKNIFFVNISMHFVFMGYLSVLIFLLSLKKKNILFSILCISALLSSIKVIGSIALELYGTFFLPIFIVIIVTLVYSLRDKKEIYISLLFVLCSFIYLYLNMDIIQILKYKENKITTLNNEAIYTNNSYFSERYNKIISYINEKTSTNDTVLVLPEGVILNYLTQRKSDNFYYYLIPPNVEIFSQNSIINNLQQELPDYIIVFNNKYNWYNTASFTTTFGSKIQGFINNNYVLEEDVSSEYDKIYKLKGKNK